MTSARVLQIQRMSTEDGPGIRTTVFFKGCTLACDWCHNPESIPMKRQLVWHGSRCIGCGCCECGALTRSKQGVEISRELCQACGDCVEACPAGALELLGQDWSVDALVSELCKDRAFFDESGGGITASGGEPSVHARFIEQLFDRCHAEGLDVALDTCGQCSEQVLRGLVSRADLVLFDLKLMDPTAHKKHTGHSNTRILENLTALWGAGQDPSELWIRTPLIPNVTATRDNIRAIASFIAANIRPARWELCSFNRLCTEKYERLGLLWPYASEPALTQDLLEELGDIAKSVSLETTAVHIK